jgi:hypothetical protein
MEKRTFSFQLAETLTDESDWYCVFDADELSEAFNVKKALAGTDKLVAECLSWERFQGKEAAAEGSMVGSTSVRRFYRALRGLHVEGTHTTYKANGHVLRGYGDTLAESLELPVRIEHRWNFQEPMRRLRQETYYRLRDAQEAEQRTCYQCTRRSVMAAPTDFHDGLPDPLKRNLRCTWVDACAFHLGPILEANKQRLAEMGVEDPETVQTRLGFDLKRAAWLADTSPETEAARAAPQA